MNATPFVVLGLIVLMFAGCVGVGAGPDRGRRTNCDPGGERGRPAFYFFCIQSP